MRHARARAQAGRFRAKREQLAKFYGLSPENHGQDLAVTVLHVPDSLDRGLELYQSVHFFM